MYMLEWVLRIADRVDALAKADPEYQELAQQRKALEPKFEALLDRMAPADRELLLSYMDVVGNMSYRTSQLAWLYGKRHPHE